MTRLGLALIAGYQRVVSPLTAPRCRFAPSCSSYAIEAIETLGLTRGGCFFSRNGSEADASRSCCRILEPSRRTTSWTRY